MRNAFTLIELLVVVTIIVVLLALLVPALDKAIAEAQLVGCSTQLRAWGQIGTGFAQDHAKRLPMAFGPNNSAADGPRVLDRIGATAEHESNGQWKNFGTPWQTWLQYGLTPRMAVCPIWQGLGPLDPTYYLSDNDPNAPFPRAMEGAVDQFAGWGKQVWIGYQWLAGTAMTRPEPTGNVFAWNSRRPAGRLSDASSGSVVASDLLYMNSGWAGPPNNFRAVAHPTDANLAQPDSMAITFGDVHVSLERAEAFEKPLLFGNTGTPDPQRFSYKGGASHYWWGK